MPAEGDEEAPPMIGRDDDDDCWGSAGRTLAETELRVFANNCLSCVYEDEQEGPSTVVHLSQPVDVISSSGSDLGDALLRSECDQVEEVVPVPVLPVLLVLLIVAQKAVDSTGFLAAIKYMSITESTFVGEIINFLCVFGVFYYQRSVDSW